MAKRVKPIPKGYHTVTPSLTQVDAARTIEFCKKAFGAKVLTRVVAPSGKLMHAEIEIGDSKIMLSDQMNDPAQAAGLYLYVDNVDKTIAKAVKAGATLVMPAQEMFWGDRFGSVTDPSGNHWAIATRVEDVDPKEVKKRAKAMFAAHA